MAQGWITYKGDDGEYQGVLCPDCMTEKDIDGLWPDAPPPDL
jgi:hypothetical protein